MSRREYTRRAAVRALGLGVVGTVAARSGTVGHARAIQTGQRPDKRIKFVEADPEAGFNFPYWLATPETFRSSPAPLLVVMTSRGGPDWPLMSGGADSPTTVAEHALSQIRSLDQVGVWVSEQLGVPQLVPVIPRPSRTVWTHHLDRQTLLVEGSKLERVDRQLLRMTEHARQEVLSAADTHDKLLFWGNSSPGIFGQRMALLHPKEILAFACSGISGIATLPLKQLGNHTLKYPVGIADLEAITGNPIDADAFDDVNKFYIHGAHDTHNFLRFEVPGRLPGVWADPDVYETAKAVYGREMVTDHFPRCHIAFEKADVNSQFRIYPEMTHDPSPASEDILAFFRRSIEDTDVNRFGQRLELPFDRWVELVSGDPRAGNELEFVVSGQNPPPEGLVTYTWNVNEGQSQSGQRATYSFDSSRTHNLSLTMETAHGQTAQRGMSLVPRGRQFGAYQYKVSQPRRELHIGQSILLELDVANVGAESDNHQIEFRIADNVIETKAVRLPADHSRKIAFSHPFEEPGTYEVSVPPAYKQTIAVREEPAPTSTAAKSPSETRGSIETSAQGPGFEALTAIAGLAGTFGYLIFKNSSDE